MFQDFLAVSCQSSHMNQSVFLYQKNSTDDWNFIGNVSDPNNIPGDFFGESTSMESDVLAVGSPKANGIII